MKLPLSNTVFAVLAAATSVAFAGASASKNPVTPPPPAPAEPLGISLTAGYDSSYVFRGVDFGDNLISVGATVPVKLSDKLTFTFAPWYGQVTKGSFSDDFAELDLVAGLSYDLGFGTIGLGYTFYYFPESDWTTHEPNITFAKSFGGLNWTIGAYLDTNADGGDPIAGVDGDEGWYFETGIDYPIKVSDSFSIVPAAKISYGEQYYGVEGFNNVLLKVAFPYQVSDSFVIAPYIAGSIALDGLDALGVDDYVYGGVALTLSF